MADQKNYITPEGHAAIEAEFQQLLKVERPEVVRVDAGRAITRVQNAQARKDGAVAQLVHQPVGTIARAALVVENPVSMLIESMRPKPASGERINLKPPVPNLDVLVALRHS